MALTVTIDPNGEQTEACYMRGVDAKMDSTPTVQLQRSLNGVTKIMCHHLYTIARSFTVRY
jgi:hypothetical protein